MRVICSKCPAQYEIPDGKIRGKKAQVTCRRCGTVIPVDGRALATPSTPPSEPFPAAEPGAPIMARTPSGRPAPVVIRKSTQPPARAAVRHPSAQPAGKAQPQTVEKSLKKTMLGGVAAPGAAPAPAAAAPAQPATPPRQAGVTPDSQGPSYRPRPEWTVAVHDQDHTEMSTRQVVELFAIGTINASTFIWKDGMDNWRTPFRIPEIAEALKARGFEPPADVPVDYDSFDASWTDGGTGDEFDESTVGIDSRLSREPQELMSAIVGSANRRPGSGPPSSDRQLRKYVDLDEEPTVAVDSSKLLQQVEDERAFTVDTLRPPPGQSAKQKLDELATLAQAPPSDKLADLPAVVDRKPADELSEHEMPTVARPSPLAEAERAQLKEGLDAAGAQQPDLTETPTPSRPSPLTEDQRAHLAAGLDRAEAGEQAKPEAPKVTSDKPGRPEEAPRALPWSSGLGGLGAPAPATSKEQPSAEAGPAAAQDATAADQPASPSQPGPADAQADVPQQPPSPETQPQPAAAAGAEQVSAQQQPAEPEAAAGASAEQLPAATASGLEQSGVAALQPAASPVAAPAGPVERRTGVAIGLALLTLALLLATGGAGAFILVPGLLAKVLPGRSAPSQSPGEVPTASATAGQSAPAKAEEASAGDQKSAAEASGASAVAAVQAESDTAPGAANASSFDKDAARRALGVAAGGATACRRGAPHARTGQVEVTFGTDGKPIAVRVTGDLNGTAEGACVREQFLNARVPPFSGEPTTLGRNVVVPAAPRPTEEAPEPAPAEPAPAEPAPPEPAPAEPAPPEPAPPEPAPAEPAPPAE